MTAEQSPNSKFPLLDKLNLFIQSLRKPKGEDVAGLLQKPEYISYPIPCTFCNRIAQDEMIEAEILNEDNFFSLENGKLIQIRHFSSCPKR